MGIIGNYILKKAGEAVAYKAVEKIADKMEENDHKKEDELRTEYDHYFSLKNVSFGREGSVDVYDETGDRVYKVKRKGLKKVHFYVYDNDSNEVFVVREEHEWLEAGNKYVFYIDDEEVGYLETNLSFKVPYKLHYKNWKMEMNKMWGSQITLYDKGEAKVFLRQTTSYNEDIRLYYNKKKDGNIGLMLYLGMKSCQESNS